jgi:DNA-binding transcriptional regulator YiaG
MRFTVGRHHYRGAGLRNVLLMGVAVGKCRKCGEEQVDIPNMADLHEKLGKALIEKPSRLTGEELKFLRKLVGLTAKQVSEETDYHAVTISNWETGKEKLTPQNDWYFRFFYARKGAEKFGWKIEELIPARMEPSRIKPEHPELRYDPKRETYEYATA